MLMNNLRFLSNAQYEMPKLESSSDSSQVSMLQSAMLLESCSASNPTPLEAHPLYIMRAATHDVPH
jgi:acetaldehyde dehydrogenase (acetylating)